MLFCATGERVKIDRPLLSFDYWTSSADTIFLELREHADKHVGTEFSDLIHTFLFSLGRENQAVEQPPIKGRRHAFVVLGHALKANGDMSDILLDRLRDALRSYNKSPLSALVLSGYGPPGRNAEHRSEALCMQQWFLQSGVPRECIIQEDVSTDTVQNVLCSTQLLVELGFSAATIITSQSHLTRAVMLFRTNVIKKELANGMMITNCLMKGDFEAQTLQEKLWMLKDLGRILGIWKYQQPS